MSTPDTDSRPASPVPFALATLFAISAIVMAALWWSARSQLAERDLRLADMQTIADSREAELAEARAAAATVDSLELDRLRLQVRTLESAIADRDASLTRLHDDLQAERNRQQAAAQARAERQNRGRDRDRDGGPQRPDNRVGPARTDNNETAAETADAPAADPEADARRQAFADRLRQTERVWADIIDAQLQLTADVQPDRLPTDMAAAVADYAAALTELRQQVDPDFTAQTDQDLRDYMTRQRQRWSELRDLRSLQTQARQAILYDFARDHGISADQAPAFVDALNAVITSTSDDAFRAMWGRGRR